MPVPHAHFVLGGLDTGQRRFLFGLDCTPDDRLDWSPEQSEKTPLHIAGSLGGFLGFVAHMITTGEMPSLERGPQPPPATRAAAREAVDQGFYALKRAVAALEKDDLDRAVTAPWGPATVEGILWVIMFVVGYFQGQLNYVQLCYGDTNPNMPPDYGAHAGG
jgi:DinB superfamily